MLLFHSSFLFKYYLKTYNILKFFYFYDLAIYYSKDIFFVYSTNFLMHTYEFVEDAEMMKMPRSILR